MTDSKLPLDYDQMLADTETPKPWWQSRAVIGALVTVASSGAAMAGYPLDAGSTTDLILAGISFAGGLLAWWGRVRAQRPISKTQVMPGLNIEGLP